MQIDQNSETRALRCCNGNTVTTLCKRIVSLTSGNCQKTRGGKQHVQEANACKCGKESPHLREPRARNCGATTPGFERISEMREEADDNDAKTRTHAMGVAILLASTLGMAACASAPGQDGYNAFLERIAAQCKPLIIGSDNIGQAIAQNGLGAIPENYNNFL